MQTTQVLRRCVTACLAASFALIIAGCGIGNSNPPSVGPIAPTLSWTPTVSSVQYGSPLTTGVLDAEANVAGNFIYTTADGQILNASTILPAGSYALSAAFTPDDSRHYTTASIRISFQVGSSAASLSWTPSTNTISEGVPLLPAILDAVGSVNGGITYTATLAGVTTAVTNDTLLSAGRYTLTASLTPSDSASFKPASKSIPFTVFAAPQAVGASSSAALEQGYNSKFVIDANGTAYFSIHSADGAGNLNNALVESVGIWNQTKQFSFVYLRNFATVNVESAPQGAASIATTGDGTIHMVWSGSDTALSDSAYADQIHYARFISGNPPGIKEETVPAAISGFSNYYSAPFTGADIWQEHPSLGEDTGGNIYIVYEGRDALPAPPPTCSPAGAIISAGASSFANAAIPADATPPVSVTVAPVTVSLLTCATQQFTATVANSTNTFVNWQVNGVVGGNTTTGTITTAGLYTAPAIVSSPAQVTVTADSQADLTKTASAVVTINAAVKPPTTGTLENGIAFLTRSKNGTYSQSGINKTPAYLNLQNYTSQLRPLILVQNPTVQHVICTGSGPGLAHQQILYGTISSGNFSGWQPVNLTQNDQQNQSAVLDSQGQVHLVWREAAPGQPSIVYYAVRAAGGVWSAPQQISTPGLYADTPTVSVDGQYVRAAWVEWQPGFTNSVGQLNNGLSATAFNDTHFVEGDLMFSMKTLGGSGDTFTAPVAVKTSGVVGYPMFSQGVPNALIWTTSPAAGAAPWSVSVGETP